MNLNVMPLVLLTVLLCTKLGLRFCKCVKKLFIYLKKQFLNSRVKFVKASRKLVYTKTSDSEEHDIVSTLPKMLKKRYNIFQAFVILVTKDKLNS